MEFQHLSIQDVILIRPRIFGDARGFFMESYHSQKFADGGINARFVQDNHSRSRQGVLRGLHYQVINPQGKLVRVVVGEVFDIAVDLRRSSPTFGQYVGALLSADNKQQLWIPPGFAHAFFVTSEWAEVLYKVTNFWLPEQERSLLWNDPTLAINWPLVAGQMPTLSAKDQAGLKLDQALQGDIDPIYA